WRGSFVVLGCVSAIWVVVWFWYFRDNPADHRRITEADLAALPPHVDRKTSAAPQIPWKALVARMIPVTIVYFCYGWTFWLYLNWLPSFFLHSYQLKLTSSALFSSSVFFAGVVGDTLGGIISDRVLHRTGDLRKARTWVVMGGFLGSLIFLLPVLFIHNLTVIALCLSAALFFAELVIGPIWSIPMDIAPQFSGTASGIMNTGSAVAAILSPLVFGVIIDLTGNWNLPFIGSIFLLALGLGLTFTMRPEKPFHATGVPVLSGAATGS
ncbi:MAG: MFS transporter, partial [Acetobacteraceae bacterium]|nr:MFS transporter [Acetobacteraceae bacterium]MBV8592459.1 MFS transporter [Acetobacteraceae bacterium]